MDLSVLLTTKSVGDFDDALTIPSHLDVQMAESKGAESMLNGIGLI